MSEKYCPKCKTIKTVSDFKRKDGYANYVIYRKCNDCNLSERLALEIAYEKLNRSQQRKLQNKPIWRVVERNWSYP